MAARIWVRSAVPGKIKVYFASASGDFFWPSDMSWYGPDSLVIYWNGGAGTEMALPYFVDLTDFSISLTLSQSSLEMIGTWLFSMTAHSDSSRSIR